MENAFIDGNLPKCGKCGTELPGKTLDYDVVNNKQDNQHYFKFVKRCTHCSIINTYYVDLEFNKRYAFNSKDVKPVR
jgi:hypothetical protein